MRLQGFDFKTLLLASAAVIGFAQPGHAQEATRQFNIPAQDLTSALNEFGRQSGRDILFSTEVAAGKRSTDVHGTMSPDAALQALLVGSGLRVRATNDSTFLVDAANTSPTQLGDASGAAPSEGDGATSEILVVGRRTLNADIRRSEDDAQPYVVFSAEDIQSSQASSIEDFLKNRLPSNAILQTSSQNLSGTSRGNQSAFDLRGLGIDETLVLVDGRRAASVVDGTGFSQPDVNGIPLSAIERIEVLPSTAGGIYGGSATGGVINIVLRHDYSGLQLQESYANSFDSDVSTSRFDLSGGTSFFDGRTRLMFSVGMEQGTGLYASDRDFAERARRLQLQNNPSFFGLYSPPGGYTPNIMSAFGDELILDGGAALGSTFTSVPVGYAGPTTDGGAALATQAGRYNLDLSNDSTGRKNTLWQGPSVSSYSLSLRQDITDSIEVFADGALTRTETDVPVTLSSSFAYIGADDPRNPFQNDIYVVAANPGLFDTSSISESSRVTIGGIIRLPHRWSAGLDHVWSTARTEARAMGLTSLIDGANVVLRDTNDYPLDYSAIAPNPYTTGSFQNNLDVTSLRLSGPILSMPGGDVTFSALMERRAEEVEDAFADDPGASLVYFYPHRNQTVNSYYAEARWPLISEANALPWARELTIQTAVRHDEYETSSVPNASYTAPTRDGPFDVPPRSTNEIQSTDYTISLRYSPIDDFVFRASYGTGFLPPSIGQIASNIQTIFSPFGPDPERPGDTIGTQVPFTLVLNGNPDLRPELSTSFSAGLIWQAFDDALRLSVDFTRIDKTDEFGTPTINDLITIPGRIERGPNLPGDPSGVPGPVTRLDFSLINLNYTQVEAVDYQIDYRIDLGGVGTLNLYAIATQTLSSERQTTTALPVLDYVGYSDGPLEWRGNFGAALERDSWTLQWNAQYFDSYAPYGALSGSFPFYVEELALSQGSATLPSQIFHDLAFRYRLGAVGPLKGAEIGFGIQNVLNEPPIILAEALGGTYSSYADPRLRRFTLSLRQEF